MARTKINIAQLERDGSAASLDVGTSANSVVQLNGSAQLPAVDGSLLTDLTKAQVGLGDVENVTLSTWTGSAYVTTVGEIDTGTWEGTEVAVAHGGTGSTTSSDARTALGLIIGTDVAAANVVPKTLFDHYADVGNTHDDGTEDNLYSDTVAADQLSANGQKLVEVEHLTLVGHATATRQIRKYFAGTLIYDTDVDVWAATSGLVLTTTIIRVNNSNVRCVVTAVTDSAVTIPPLQYTTIGSLDLEANTSVLKTTGAADDTGAAADDIVNTMATIQWIPAA